MTPEAHEWLEDFPTDGHGLRDGGPFMIEGPDSVLGAAGILGPLGPLNRNQNYRADSHGVYRDRSGNPVRSVDAAYGSGKKTWDLYELYDEATAKNMQDNDTSFAVDGSIAKAGNSATDDTSDTYKFTSKEDQWVSALVIPTNPQMSFQQAMGEVAFSAPSGWDFGMSDLTKNFDDFDLEIMDKGGNVLAKSDLKDMSNWICIHVPKGTELQARVTLKNKATDRGEAPYRLLISGSTGEFNGIEAGGPQIKRG
jgi:hypothetical protein